MGDGVKMNDFYVDNVLFSECKEWLLKKHYAHRIPSISYSFGLFEKGILKGVCTFGTPLSSPLKNTICGIDNAKYVIELNRLVVDCDKKNITSYFVSQCMKKIDKPKIIVSYADTEMNHHGYIYQACNFIYTGMSIPFKDLMIKGYDNLHNQTIMDMSRGEKNRVKFLKDKYGEENIYYKERSRKHRYIYFLGSKKEKKDFLKALCYKIEPYPKGDNINYDASYQIEPQQRLF